MKEASILSNIASKELWQTVAGQGRASERPIIPSYLNFAPTVETLASPGQPALMVRGAVMFQRGCDEVSCIVPSLQCAGAVRE
jgi:hypothetical protein